MITSVITGAATLEVAPALSPLITQDPNAFVVTHKDSSGTVFRTTTISKVSESGSARLRMDTTIEGSTTRHEQTEPSAGTLVLEKGRLNGTTFEPIWQETLVKNESIVGKRIHRRTIKERPSSAASWHTVSDIETTEENLVNEWVQTKEVIDPTGAALTSTWSYYQPGELTGPGGSVEGLGRLKLFSRYDGYQTFHTYTLNETTTTTPYAGTPSGKVTTDTWNPGARTRTITTTAGGQVLSKTQTIYTDTSITSIDHTSQSDTLTTITHYVPSGQDFGGKPLRILHPDGTLTTYAYSRNAGGGYTTVTDNGSTANSTTVAKGTRTTNTVNSRGTTILSQTTAIGYGTGSALFGSMAVTSIDNLGRALTVAHHPLAASVTGEVAAATGAAWTTTTQYSCCGVTKETDMYGIPTFHAYDALQNPIKSNRLGVTYETVRNGLTTETHRYPETVSISLSPAYAGTPSTLISKSVTNLAGTLQESWSADPTSTTAGALVKYSSTTTTYQPAAGLSMRRITTAPDNFTQTTDVFLDGRTATTSGALSPTMTYSYSVNATGEVSSQSYLDGTTPKETTTIQSDWVGRTLTTTKGPRTVTQDYNSLGQLESSTDADNVFTLFAYNGLGERTTTAISADESIDLDGTDRISVTTTEPGIYATKPVITTTSSVYATNGSATPTVVSTTHATPDGLESWTVIPGVANPSHTTSTIGAGGAWSKTVIHPDLTSAKNTYSGGRLEKTETFTSGTSPSLVTITTYLYDSLGRPWKSTDARTGTTETAYISTTCDSVISVKAPGNRNTSFTYNSNGHRLTTTLPDDTVMHTSYYPNGEVKATWGSQTYPVYYTYDHAGRRLTMRTKPTLDTNGVPINAGASLTTWNYSPVTGLLESKLDADGKGPSYTYTDAGRMETRTWARLISATDPKKVKTEYHYTNGLLTSVTYNDGTPNLEYTYTRFGAQDTVKRGGMLHADYDYDDDGASATLALTTEKLNQDTAATRTLNRYPDPLGRPQSLEVSGEYTAAYGYDAAGRLNSIWNHPSLDTNKAPIGDANFIYGYETNSRNLIHTVTGPAHIVTNTWETTRDALDTKTNHVTVGSGGYPSSFDYSVNSLGQRTAVGPVLGESSAPISSNPVSWGWSYNGRGELQSADFGNDVTANTKDRYYAFDAIGNRDYVRAGVYTDSGGTQLDYDANTLNQYTKANNEILPIAPAPAPYDLDGNLRFDGGVNQDSQDREYLWDAENRLIEVRDVSGTTPVTLASYSYDHQSRMIGRTTTAATAEGAATILYLYDGWNRIAKYAGGTLQTTYTWGMDHSGSMQGAGGVGCLLSVANHGSSSTDHFFPTYDGNGNVTEYLKYIPDDPATTGSNEEGVITAVHFEYDAFGNVIASSGVPGPFEFRFSTKPQDAATGLYYYGYRWFDPVTGRWPSRDPIEEEGGLNYYSIANNETISRIDILGLSSALDRVSAGAYEPYWDLDANTDYELYPGGTKSKPKYDSHGITMMKYRIKPVCKCENYGSPPKYYLKTLRVEIYSEVHLLGLLLQVGQKFPNGKIITDDIKTFAHGAELDHVQDYATYADSEKPELAVLRIEQSLIKTGYDNEKLCMESAKNAVLSDNDLRALSEEANIKSVAEWDNPKQKDGYKGRIPHAYPGIDWLTDPAYERYKHR